MVNELFSKQRSMARIHCSKIASLAFFTFISPNVNAWEPFQDITNYSSCSQYKTKDVILVADVKFDKYRDGEFGSMLVKDFHVIYNLKNLVCLRGCEGKRLNFQQVSAINLNQTVYRPDMPIAKSYIDRKRIGFFFSKWEDEFSSDKVYVLDQDADWHFRANSVHAQRVSGEDEQAIIACSKPK